MTAPILLLLLALAAAWLGTRVLARATWPRRAPGLGIAVWQGLTATIALSVILAGLSLLLPRTHFSTDLATLLRACVAELQHQYAAPGGIVLIPLGGAVAVGASVRVVWGVGREISSAWSARRAHRATVDLVGQRDPHTGAMLLEHPAPMVYCLPGRSERVVITRGAQQLLSPGELACVLAHERAHLRARHDLAVAASEGLRRAFFGATVFAVAAERIKELVEMHADDGAGREQRLGLADALVQLAGARTPAGALSAGGATAVARVARLSQPQPPLRLRERARILCGLTAMLVTPVALALIPAGASTVIDCCLTAAPGA